MPFQLGKLSTSFLLILTTVNFLTPPATSAAFSLSKFPALPDRNRNVEQPEESSTASSERMRGNLSLWWLVLLASAAEREREMERGNNNKGLHNNFNRNTRNNNNSNKSFKEIIPRDLADSMEMKRNGGNNGGYMCHFKLCQLGATSGKRRLLPSYNSASSYYN